MRKLRLLSELLGALRQGIVVLGNIQRGEDAKPVLLRARCIFI